ncbi:MAG: hypothetical protein DMF90_27790, partial [Acidobacteria bacterium]
MVAWLSGGRVKRRRLPAWLLTIPIFAVVALLGKAQTTERRPDAVAPVPRGLSDKPVALVTEDGLRLRVVPIATGLSHPWGMAFLPDGGSMLVTERPGRLRIIRDGVLDPTPIAGVPKVNSVYLGGLDDVALHPDFTKNQYVYLSYAKSGDRGVTLAV